MHKLVRRLYLKQFDMSGGFTFDGKRSSIFKFALDQNMYIIFTKILLSIDHRVEANVMFKLTITVTIHLSALYLLPLHGIHA